METLSEILEGFVIAPWEAMALAILAGGCILLGRYKALLLITFVFSYYWGFISLLETQSYSGGAPMGTVILYIGSGTVMFGLVSANYLMK